MLETLVAGTVGKPVMVFIHGWPDTAALWSAQREEFSTDFRCVAITLPAYGAGDRQPVDFPQGVELIWQTIEPHRLQAPDERVILVGHDWGAYYTYLLEQAHPERVDKIVTIDVGADFRPRTLLEVSFVFAYQGCLLLAYGFGTVFPWFGNVLTRALAYGLGAPRPWQAHYRMNAPYFYAWRGLFFRKYRRSILRKYRPSRPLLYLFGTRKLIHFHSTRWPTTVESYPGSQSVGFERAGHWVMKDCPNEMHAVMNTWLGRQPS